MPVLARVFESHQVDDIDKANPEFREVLTQQLNRS